MRVAILSFSPSGNTAEVSQGLQRALAEKGIECSAVEMAGDEMAFVGGRWREALEARISEHDIIVVGGPVYAHHLHYNVKTLIRSLPDPDGKWGRLAIPFVTYGGVSSGVALKEAGEELGKGGRTVVAGMKIAMSHRMTRAFMDREFNGDLPKGPAEESIRILANRIASLQYVPNPADARSALGYYSIGTWLKAKVLFREEKWQRERYPKVAIDPDACSGCGKCVRSCPVLRLRKRDDGAVRQDGPDCIHCLNCVAECPKGAMQLQGDIERGRRFMARMIERHGNREVPASAVYPLRESGLLSGGSRIGNALFSRLLDALDKERRSEMTATQALVTAGVRCHSRILEMGCGSGYYTRQVPQLLGGEARYVAIDLHPQAIERTASRIPSASGSRIEVLRGNALQTQFHDRAFDLVLLFGLLPSPFLPLGQIIPETMRILEPGGEVAIRTLDRSWKHGKLQEFGLEHVTTIGDIHRYRKVA